MPFAIRCSEVTKTYDGRPPVEAVRGIDLVVESGECFGVLGPNGAGKTTLIEILEGLLPATSGQIEVLGLSWQRDAQQIREQIGVSLQETQLAEKLTVQETLTLFRSFYRSGLSPQEAMERVSLTDKAGTWIKKLSGGQKQRLAVATALIGDPQLFFLDEPTTGLDPQSRRELWSLVLDLGQRGRTVLLTTHYMEEAERLCDRLAIVDRGKVIALGSPQELIAGLGGEHVVEFSVDTDGERQLSERLWQGVEAVTAGQVANGHVRLSVTQPHVAIPEILRRLHQDDCRIASLSTRQASLEDVFVKIAGRTLQEAEEQAS